MVECQYGKFVIVYNTSDWPIKQHESTSQFLPSSPTQQIFSTGDWHPLSDLCVDVYLPCAGDADEVANPVLAAAPLRPPTVLVQALVRPGVLRHHSVSLACVGSYYTYTTTTPWSVCNRMPSVRSDGTLAMTMVNLAKLWLTMVPLSRSWQDLGEDTIASNTTWSCLSRVDLFRTQ